MDIDNSTFPLFGVDEALAPCRAFLKEFLTCETARVVPTNHLIFSQGDSPHTVCLICSGFVKLTRTEADGSLTIVGLRKKGWLLGAAAVLPGLRYAATAETVTRCKLCFFPTERFFHAMDTSLPFARWVATALGVGLYSGVLSISNQNCLSGRQRLERFILEMIEDRKMRNPDKATKIPIPLKNWEVAQLLGLTPEHLSRLIKKMENEGIILRENGWMIVNDPKKLSLSRTSPSESAEPK